MASWLDSVMDAPERERYLAGVDTLAKTLVDRAAPVRFGVATTPTEREAIWRLRARVIVERGWARADQLPGGMERDRHDDRAIHIAGWEGDTLAATARIVLPSPGEVLPTEEHFEVTAEPQGQIANLDRFIVAREYSNPSHRVTLGLAFACWLELRRNGFHLFLGVVTPGIIRLYRRAGWRVTPIGPSRFYWSEERMPCRFDPFDGFATPIPTAADGVTTAR
jgi:N-acyl-L-homoserine lactone synthetase